MNATLQSGLKALERRAVSVGVIAGAGRALVISICLMIVFAWTDLIVELPARMRAGADFVALAAMIVLCAMACIAAMRAAGVASLARRVDTVADAGGQVLSGVDLAITPPAKTIQTSVTAGLASIAVQRAANLVAHVSPRDAVPGDRARRPLILFSCITAAVLLAALIFPRLVATQWLRFADPYGDHPPYSPLAFEVSPGATKVIYGKSFDVQVNTAGPTPERVEFVFKNAGVTEETLPMFPQSDGKWQATLANVTSDGEYFVRAGRARSHRYPVEVITVPKIESVRFRILPPTYTNAGAYEGPLPQQGIAGLPGTKVQMWVKSNRPLSSGKVDVTSDQQSTTQQANPEASLAGQGADPSEVSGSFTITAAGKMSLSVTDVAGQASTEPFTANITLLSDAKPVVRVTEPRPESLATPDVALNVAVSAEDDYGVSKVQLYRSVNESTAAPQDIPVPAPPPTRVPVESPLKLSELGLKPGDVVKLYARAQDTDPAGPKGSESSVVNVRIISQEEMKKLLMARDAMDVLQSKYEQAARRMEKLDEQMKKLQEKIAKSDSKKPADEELRKALEKLSEDAARDAKAIEESAKIDLPVDLDKALTKQLEELAKKTEDLKNEAKKASTQPGLSVAGANDKIAEMRKKLGAARDEFAKEATAPLEHLAKIFPLLEDQAQYLELYAVQKDLAERMASLKGQDGKDDPQLKARMRDLEEEQRLVRESLRQLLDNIDDHAAELPEDKKLDDLRETAKQFAEAVRASEAAAEMNNAESKLAEFAGTEAQTDSKEAAEILNKFIGRCNAMGDKGGTCMKFQPKLASGMGNSVQQLLDSMSMGKGQNGMGAGGGFSARRNSLANVGLYGTIPTRTEKASNERGGNADRGVAADGRGAKPDDTNPDSIGPAGKTNAAGESDAAVPPQYRRRNGEYFQRVADELGEK